jgi:hypothetical protein
MKNILLTLVIISTSLSVSAQTTAIPDAFFEQALIALGLDNTLDGGVLTANIDTVTSLYILSFDIADLTGIEDFTALYRLHLVIPSLTEINISQNSLLDTLMVVSTPLASLDLTYNPNLDYLLLDDTNFPSLDVTQNPTLSFLWLSNSQLTSLDVAQNPNLSILNLRNNQLTNIDVSQNANLNFIDVSGNQLTSLDLSQNNALFRVNCDTNQLTCLNVTNITNGSFFDLSAGGNPNLTCIEVDDVAYATANWTEIDAQASFSTNCNNLCSVGINENSLSNISLYPNPTAGNITIGLEKTTPNLNLSLTNALGQVVLTKNYSSTNYINLDLDAPKGIYFLRLESNGKVITKKIIKE